MKGLDLGEAELREILNSLTESEASELLDKELRRDFRSAMNLCVKWAELILSMCKERPNGYYYPLVRKDELVWALLHTIRQLDEGLRQWQK